MSLRLIPLALGIVLLGGCDYSADERPPGAEDFPRAYRPVSDVSGNAFSNEQQRDDRREAETVMDEAGIAEGMSVADIGAGEGYYTVRLANRVGENGRVLAGDIDEDA